MNLASAAAAVASLKVSLAEEARRLFTVSRFRARRRASSRKTDAP